MEEIILTVDDSIAPSLFAAFVREHPIRQIPVLDDDGNPVIDGDGKETTEPECTPAQQVKRYAVAQIAREVEAGAEKLRLDSNPLNKDLIETVINQNQD